MEEEPMIYEVWTYTLRPGTVAEFAQRFAKRLPLREQYSKSDTPGKAGGLMSGAASKAVAPVTSVGANA